ncbi:fibronectin type III domain-containing protein [Paenibacillus sp. GSMTC-2017]|uniref:S8 family serine peptidase n=1 Tax=Paenibacillus sp. GSMTC-2017 TaxID=2794350 RepID=UPI0018D6AC33|nr:S8 family serine peptidase [Paenibacillus sp. GSMTC-2017]MBH5318412.1 fibronectin type III domain-containing protein [Paenibacillus sp. GSMTC-2017]
MFNKKIGSFALTLFILLTVITNDNPSIHANVEQSILAVKDAQVQNGGQIVIKFKPEANLPYYDGAERALSTSKDNTLTSVLSQYKNLKLNRLFDTLDETSRIMNNNTDIFHRYFTVDIPTDANADKLLAKLNGSPLVETAYLAPALIEDPSAPYTPNTTPVIPYDDPLYLNQAHGQLAPIGINSSYAWQFEGGDGKGITYVDIEQGWALNHEDLAAHNVEALPSILMSSSASHGSAVLGVISAVDNSIGHVGLANKATPKVNSWRRIDGSSNIAAAILTSVPVLQRGDVILIEVQSISSTSNGQYVPMEVFQAEFDAIRYATDQGIIVVEAGANGSVDLDTYQDHNGKYILNVNSPDYRDSGAILVGAASSASPHERMYYSSYGSRIDSFGYGENVHTLSAVDLNSTTGYTSYFSGTSSASPIVTAAVLSLQGIAKAKYGIPYSPEEVRNLLRNESYNTASSNPSIDRIGTMPNLQNIIDNMLAPGAASGDIIVPTAPSNLTTSNITESTVNLTWSPSTDNIGVSGYDIFQNGLKIGSATGTTYHVSGLPASTTFSFTVKARDAANNTSVASNVASVTTSAGPQIGQTFVVSAPANTPANASIYMYVHGLNNSWSVNDENYKLTKNTNGTYSITLNIPVGTSFHYNFSRGTWGSMEVTSGGGYVGPRPYTVTNGSQLQPVTVARWSDL